MTLSQDIIEYLHETFGDFYNQIGRKSGLSKSFISRIANGERGLTLGSLKKLEEAYEIPLPVLLLNATKDENVPEKLKPLYKSVKKTLENAIELQEIFNK